MSENMQARDAVLAAPPFALNAAEKNRLLGSALAELTLHHAGHCPQYAGILAAQGRAAPIGIADVPFLPVRLFKELDLKSIPADAVFKTLTSSGTTGQVPSRIYLDQATAQAQSRALAAITTNFIGKDRRPMLIIDHPGVVRDRTSFSARGAGILGMMTYGRAHIYALNDEDMGLNLPAITEFAEKHAGKPIFAFGFTFMVWKYFLSALERAGITLDFPGSVLIHSGGWKKLEDEAVSNEQFKSVALERAGFDHVHNFYEPLGIGQEGLIQVVSAIPLSYPGHSLLTEDRGVLTGEDDCPCGRMGRTFRVLGRIPAAEMRGCSDTHAAAA
ncbi:MAG: acyl-protein synthetase [Sphingomonadales bacterium 12-62-5]|nr:MAG: acyl-protein synthetase [Sphingomonadales bacterium 12-62-5]